MQISKRQSSTLHLVIANCWGRKTKIQLHIGIPNVVMISSSCAFFFFSFFVRVLEGKRLCSSGSNSGEEKVGDMEEEWIQGVRATVKHSAVVADKCFFFLVGQIKRRQFPDEYINIL